MKRFDIYRDYDGWRAEESDTGEFVRFEDVESLLAENKVLDEKLAFWRRRANQRQIDINELKQNPATPYTRQVPPEQTEPHILEQCKHEISIFKSCKKCDEMAVNRGERFFNLPQTGEVRNEKDNASNT